MDPDGKAVFENAQKLMDAGLAVLADPSVQPGVNGGATWCNRGVGLIEARGGNTTSYGNGQPNQYFRANEMIANKLTDKNFATVVTEEQAVEYAKQGATVIAAWQNPGKDKKGNPLPGHVAIVAPVDMKRSGTMGRDVPSVFNVGPKDSMGIRLTSGAFGTTPERQPTYYIRNSDLNTLSQRANGSGFTSSGGVSVPADAGVSLNSGSQVAPYDAP